MLKNILLLPLLAVLLFACKKETPTKPSSQDDSKKSERLVKQIRQYWSEEPQEETITYFYYNDKKQLIKEVESDHGEMIDSTVYIYNSNENLKFELRMKYMQVGMDTVNKYFYDASNRLIKSTSFSGDTIDAEFFYSYKTGANPIEIFSDFKHSPSERYQMRWQNGNLMRLTMTEFDGKKIQNAPPLYLTYDKMINPFQFNRHDELMSSMHTVNNILSIKQHTDSLNYQTHCSYTYENRYPISIMKTIFDETGTVNIEITYFKNDSTKN